MENSTNDHNETPRPSGPPTRTTDERIRLARRWGRANGFEGAAGGWIYRTTLPGYGSIAPHRLKVCQGWAGLYRRYWKTIEEAQ